jgi:hypothetical protein
VRKSESKLPEELEFTANIEKRLKDVGNHCHGNVTRALQKDASISESTKRLADSLAAKLMAI